MATAPRSSIRRELSPTTNCWTRRRVWRRRLLAGRDDLAEERVAFLVTPGFPWVAVQWGIWRAGGVAVPLPLNSTRSELEYFIDDTRASVLVFDALAETLLAPIATARGIRALSCDDALAHPTAQLPDVAERAARHDSLHQRHHQPSQGRGHNPCQHHARRSPAWWRRGSGRPTIASCCACRCTTCTESSTWSRARCGRARPARCCRASTRMRCGSASPAAV